MAPFLLLLAGIACSASLFAADPQFPLEERSTGREYPNITDGAGGRLVMSFVRKAERGHIVGMAYSDDGGVSWIERDSISWMRASALGLQRRPTVVQSSDGSYVACYEDVKSGLSQKVWMTRSDDNGVTWSAPFAPVSGEQAGFQDFSSMAVGPDGRIVCAFLSATSQSPGAHVFVITSTDGGRTWSSPVRVNNISWTGVACECCMTSVAVGSDGVVAVAFRANRSNVRDVHVAFSIDGGATFSDPQLVQNAPWSIDGCPGTGPNVALDAQNQAHVTWRDYRDVNEIPVVYYARITRTQTTTPANVDLSSAVSDYVDYPSVSVSADGGTIVVMHESGTGLRSARSDDSGVSFRTQVVDPMVQRNASAYSVMLPSGDALAVWRSLRGEQYDVATWRSTLVTSVEEPVTYQQHDLPPGWSIRTYDLMGRIVTPRDGELVAVVVLDEHGRVRGREWGR
jgi:hypothetical protein